MKKERCHDCDCEKWEKYVIPQLQYEELCPKCFQKMKKLFPNGWREASNQEL